MKGTDKEDEVIRPFANAIVSSGIIDCSIDYAEMGLDECMDIVKGDGLSEVLKEIPAIRTAYAIFKFTGQVSHAFLIKKQLTFFRELFRGEPNEDAIRKRKEAYANGEKWFYEEVETLCIHIDRSNDIKKERIHAGLYNALLNGLIGENVFIDFLNIIDTLLVSDLEQLFELYNNQEAEADIARCNRLQALGLLHSLAITTVGTITIDKFQVTDQGKLLCEILHCVVV